MRFDNMRSLFRSLTALAALALFCAPGTAFAQNAGGIPADVLRIVTPITVGDCLQVSKNTVPYAAADAGAPCGTGGGGGGTVTSFSFLNGNGFNGTVLNASTTPSLSLAPSFTGFAYSNGTGFSAASTTGSGNLVLANSPTLVTPNLGTPSAINLLNGLGLPFSGLATGTLATGTLTVGSGATLTYAGTGVLNANQIGSLAWPTPISGDCLTTNGTALLWGTCGGAGTSFEVNGTATAASNPINFLDSALTNGLTLTFANPSAGNVQLGLTGTLSTAGGGTGLTALTQYSLLSGGASTANLIAPSATVGEALISNGTTAQPGYSTALAGVTSVNGTTIPAASTLVTSGGALGTPSSGTLTNAVGLPLTTGVTGILPIANGGTNNSAAPTDGQLLIGNGTTYALNTLTAGTGVTITNGAGAITISTAGTGFNTLTSGENITATMTVGSGASLTYSGTGSVNASEVAGVIKAVNTAAAGNTLTPNCTYAMVKVTGTTYLIPAPTQTAPSTADTGGTLAGGVYYYVVTASTAVGQTTESTQQSIPSITIAAPTNGAITASAAPLGATTYEVQSTWVNADGETVGAPATSYATTNVAAPAAGTATTATTGGTGLAASTTYYMVVTATNANGQTTISGVESVATGTGTTNTVTANWTDVTGATGYDVYISTATITAGEATVAYSTAASTATSYTFTAVPSTTATTPSANTTAGGITVAAPASPPSSATGWNAYVCSGSGCTNETLQNTTPLGTTTAWVEPTTGLTTTGAVTPLTNTAYATNTNENTVNWDAVTGATGYTVYRSTTSGNFTNATSYAVSGGSTVTFLDTGATGTTATPPTTNTTGLFTINTPGTCTPVDGQQLEIKIISPAGGLLTYSWGSGYQASGQLAFPTTSYAAGDEDFFTVQYDADLTKWDLMATNQGF